MNEQQREVLEKAQKVFPRGLLACTIAPNGDLHVSLMHPAVPNDNTSVDLDPEKEPDAVALDQLQTECIDYWECR